MPKFMQRAIRICDDGLGFAYHLIHQVQLPLALRSRSNLFLRNLRSRPGKAREVQRAVLLERRQSLRRRQNRLHLETAVHIEIDAIKSSVGGAYLILRADCLSDHFLLYLESIGSER